MATEDSSSDYSSSVTPVITAIDDVIKTLRIAPHSFRKAKAVKFLEAIRSTIVAYCECEDNNGKVQSYYEFPE